MQASTQRSPATVGIMRSSSSSSTTSDQNNHHTQQQSQQQHYEQQQGEDARIDEEDLLALLGSDTFSLESSRDRDLKTLSSFLANALPSSTTASLTSGGMTTRPKARHYNSTINANGWNQQPRRHSNAGAAEDEGNDVHTPMGTPATYQSQYLSSQQQPAAPANSYSSAYGAMMMGSGGGTTDEEVESLSRWRNTNGGCRAPAPSRDRRNDEQFMASSQQYTTNVTMMEE